MSPKSIIEEESIEITKEKIIKSLGLALFIIFFNKGLNELNNTADSNFIDELFTELVLVSFYFIAFVFIYYFGELINYLTHKKVYSLIMNKLWRFYFFIHLVLLQFNGAFQPIKLEKDSDFAYLSPISYVFFFIFFHLSLLFAFSYKKEKFKKRYFLLIPIISSILLLTLYLLSIIEHSNFIKH